MTSKSIVFSSSIKIDLSNYETRHSKENEYLPIPTPLKITQICYSIGRLFWNRLWINQYDMMGHIGIYIYSRMNIEYRINNGQIQLVWLDIKPSTVCHEDMLDVKQNQMRVVIRQITIDPFIGFGLTWHLERLWYLLYIKDLRLMSSKIRWDNSWPSKKSLYRIFLESMYPTKGQIVKILYVYSKIGPELLHYV